MKRLSCGYRAIWSWGLMCLFLSTNALAHFEFTPIISNLTTTGKSAHTIAQVINRSDESIAISIKPTARRMLEDGTEERPETNDISVFPNQFLLGPKETKLVKIAWQGQSKLENEQAYRVIVEELPVEFTPQNTNKSSVKIMINYVGALYVSSQANASDLKLERVEIAPQDKRKLSFLFINNGTAHTIIKAPQIEITAKAKGDLPEKKITLEKNLIEQIEGKNILAKAKLRINIPLPNNLSGHEQFEWSFKYEN